VKIKKSKGWFDEKMLSVAFIVEFLKHYKSVVKKSKGAEND